MYEENGKNIGRFWQAGNTMYTLLIYDIPDDRKRSKIADTCLDYGLDRVQYSAFGGNLSRNYQQELFLRLKRILGKKPGKLLLIPVCETDWKTHLEHIAV